MKKYDKIFNDIIEKMKCGELKKGDKLKSVRELSKHYDCNKTTVLKALGELKLQSYIYSVEKSGYYILKDINDIKDDDDSNIDFIGSLPDSSQIPFGDFKMCINQVLDIRDNYLFDYYKNQQGLDELINSFNNLLADYSVYAKKEQIVVTSGTQQALYILSVMKFDDKKDTILIEQPTYNRMNVLVNTLGLKYETINRGVDEIDLCELEKIFAKGNIKFFYTIPRVHNPLGGSYSTNEKRKIVELANKYDVFIIEDDYMADFEKGVSQPLHYYDVSDRVIYIKSFSSIIFPSLRIASVVVPKAIIKDFLDLKSAMDYDTNLLIQKALSIYIDNGMFNKHRQRIVSLYDTKHKKLKEILDKSSIKKYKLFDTKSVFKIKDSTLISPLKRALEGKYKVDFMEKCYIGRCPYKYVKIDVRNMNINQIYDNVDEFLQLLISYVE